MLLFAAAVAVVFGFVGRAEAKTRLRYGLKVFLEFMGIGLALAWLMYLVF